MAAGALALGASACLAFLMLIVVADVALRAVDPAWRIFGMLDYVEFSLDWLIFLAIPLALFQGDIVRVDLVDGLDRRGVFAALGAVLTLATLVLLATQIVRPALDILEWDERTLDLGLRKFHYWIAIWVGVGLSVVAAGIMLAQALSDMRRRHATKTRGG